jgi:hypothetical protein
VDLIVLVVRAEDVHRDVDREADGVLYTHAGPEISSLCIFGLAQKLWLVDGIVAG